MGSIILFGSYTKKTYDEESDVDFFYIGEENETIMKQIKGIGTQYRKVINIKRTIPHAFEKALREKEEVKASAKTAWTFVLKIEEVIENIKDEDIEKVRDKIMRNNPKK